MKVFYTDRSKIPLPKKHPFPIEKYGLLKQRLIQDHILDADAIQEPEPASVEALIRVHDSAYVERVIRGRLTEQQMQKVGFPWTPMVPTRSRRSCGATMAACRSALEEGVGVNLAGGTHHAYPDHGEGYCVFNDCAVAARSMQAEGLAQRIVIIDCDVHQGNGTAATFREDPTVFTFSIHGEHNFPFDKETGDLDIGLADGTGDDGYLSALEAGLAHALERSGPDLAIYIAGADPFSGDRLGRLDLSKQGLAQRDEMVLGCCRERGLPVGIAMGGGYAPEIGEIVDIHVQTIAMAAGP